VLPLLLFLFFVWHFELIVRPEAQLGLLAAVVIALLGYTVFLRMVGRISALAQVLDAAAPAVRTREGAANSGFVAGLGPVAEIGEMAHAFSRMLEDLRASTERLEDLVFKLGTLNEMVEMVAKIPRIQDLLGDVLERTMRAVHARIGSIMLLDRDRQTLKVVAARGLPDEALGTSEVRVGEGIAGRAVQLGEPVLVEDIEADPRFGKPNDPKYGGGSFICMPLRVADRIIGVINLAKKESAGAGVTPPFSRSDLQFLNTLMTYTAYAVDNARLLEEAQTAARKLNEVVEDQQLRLTLAQQQVLQAAKLSALGELVTGVSHELNNPLAVLQGSLEILADEAPANVQPRLRIMQNAIDRATRIVQGLLTFGRRRPLQRQRVNLRRLLEQVLEVSAVDLRLARVTVETDVALDLPEVWADDHQLQQVLLNLITNAKQALADVVGERRIRISIHPAGGDRVSLVVEDTGPGIPPDLLSTIFDPFVTTKGVRGTGLGLSISYGIVREHGGQITVDSRPGAGARFTVELPIGTVATDPQPAAAPSSPPKGALVLVAEDDDAVREILQGHLEHAGYRTVSAVSAEDALAHLDASIEAVVADFHLPGLDGLALYREAVSRVPSLADRFVFVSAGALPESARHAVDGDRARLLHKPFTRQQLLDAMTKVLG
jgi:signal transduction histidine kinase/CheY-like chemotaxis protein/HAMP domain-containing protein